MAGSSSSRSDDDDSTIKASDERTPLLPSIAPAPTAEPIETLPQASGIQGIHEGEDEDAPLPLGQIFLLCYTRLVEPIAFFSIFPYVNFMVEKTGGIQPNNVGFYTGLIESLFSATQMCVMIFWGKAADRFGRKPILVLSLCGVTASTALFGLSKNIWQMFLFRCLAGVFAGTIVTVRAMITENSTKKTQAKAFSYFAFAGNLGIFSGPLIGGALESPAEKFSSTFGKIQFFHDYPYAFPGFISASVGASATILSALFVKETLHLHHGKKNTNEPPMSTWELLKYPGVAQVCIIYIYILLLAFAFTAGDPVFLYTPIDMGGIGFPASLIAAALALGGFSQAFWLLFVFPPLHKRIGTGGIFRLCAACWPFFFAVSPICNVFLRHNLKALFWAVGPLVTAVGSGVAMAFTANQLAVNDIAPSHETLGTLNAIVLAGSSGLRAFVPALSTSLYAVGVNSGIFGGQLFWIILIALAVGLNWVIRYLPARAEGKLQQEDDRDA
ncbi:MFS general substrate transporter [Lindgomyces ingoldianus]|uniref:MFS general substrate transporter n=1 Tax=Lindgomyces ingoldianus TaxID=673940 RepID=A0ACB6QY05_9PLEO|nr:MFS general substrate transporter [Lindgomyces ingoldianus]KAF2471162.1 MFS general substrate transporter [Lindgomyces ingoldianus]